MRRVKFVLFKEHQLLISGQKRRPCPDTSPVARENSESHIALLFNKRFFHTVARSSTIICIETELAEKAEADFDFDCHACLRTKGGDFKLFMERHKV